MEVIDVEMGIIKDIFCSFSFFLFVDSGKAEMTIELKNPLNVKV